MTNSTYGWAAHLRAAGPAAIITDDAADAFLVALADHGGAISLGTDNYSATLTVDDAPDAETALRLAGDIFRQAVADAGMPALPIVRAEVITFDEQDLDLAEPLIPPLVGVREIAELLGVTKQRVDKLRTKADFPDPIAHLAAGPVWNRHAIEAFDEHWERRTGRPPKPVTLENVMAAEGEILVYNGEIYDSIEDMPEEGQRAAAAAAAHHEEDARTVT